MKGHQLWSWYRLQLLVSVDMTRHYVTRHHLLSSITLQRASANLIPLPPSHSSPPPLFPLVLSFSWAKSSHARHRSSSPNRRGYFVARTLPLLIIDWLHNETIMILSVRLNTLFEWYRYRYFTTFFFHVLLKCDLVNLSNRFLLWLHFTNIYLGNLIYALSKLTKIVYHWKT